MIEIQPIHIASMMAMFQASFLGVFLFNTRNGSKASNRILSWILFAFTCIIASQWMLSTQPSGFRKLLGHGLTQCSFLVGPMLYLYIRAALNSNLMISKNDRLHFIPFLFFVIYVIIKFHAAGSRYPFKMESYLFRIAILIQTFIYFWISIRLLKSSGLSFRIPALPAEDFKFVWLRFLMIGCVLIWLCQLSIFILWDVMKSVRWCIHLTNLYLVTFFVFFNMILYYFLKKSDFFLKDRRQPRSLLNTSDQDRLYCRLIRYMDENKPYLEPSLSLLDLSTRLSIPARYLSYIINERRNQHFYDFINSYRIEESIQRLKSLNDKSRTILEIAYDVGFNSKSTFNAAFKKLTGYTPREYSRHFAAS